MELIHRYAGKDVDPKYYSTIKVSGDNAKPKKLTRKEFEEGKAGLVYYDNKTGKLVFDD